jgi:polysaccharide deacetylase family protein (PEP-CTERM system associated)
VSATSTNNGGAPRPRHALSVDVEDWYHDGGLTAGATGERVEANTDRLLDLCAATNVRATFFFLGEVATRFPALVRRAAAAGHEIGSHGYSHRPLGAMLWREFRADVERSLRVLEDVSGAAVRGFRAPYFSIKAGVRWPIEVLGELGVRYDSSVLPIDRAPGLELICPRTPFRHHNGLWEVPVAVLQVGSFWYLPLASGNGMRLLPERFMQRVVARFEREVGAGLFYLHPWELDPASPTGPGPGRWLLRIGRARLSARLSRLLREKIFAPVVEVFPEVAQ